MESISSMKTSHILLLPFPAWGHIRPFCVLAARLVHEQDNAVVSLIVAPHMLDKARVEVSRQFRDESSENSKVLQRIRIFSPCPLQDSKLLSILGQKFADAYPAIYQTLYQAKPIMCSVTGTTFDAVPPPSVAILDIFTFPQLRATRAVSGSSVPIIALVTGGVGSTIRRYGPESMGGMGDYGVKLDAEMTRTGLPAEEIGPKILYHTEGKVVRIPGVPAMYDYEYFPQKLALQEILPDAVLRAYDVFRECDAVAATSSYVYERVSLEAMRQWLSGMQKGFHVLGPLLPAGYGTDTQNNEAGASTDIEVFLEEMLAQHGKRSVFFISFGTVFWPADTQYIEELIEALVEKKTPFIFAHASPFAKLSEQLQSTVKSSGLGMITPWSPQQFILNHPATGWFVSHGGFNSITESLASGIPLICWPFIGDQPVAAAYLTENLNVAFEFVEVRTGPECLKPIHRIGRAPKGTREAAGIEIRQTIDLCRGEKGQELRRNAAEIKVKFAKAWEEDGIARKELRDFLHKYT